MSPAANPGDTFSIMEPQMNRLALRAALLVPALALAACQDADTDLLGPPAGDDLAAAVNSAGGNARKGGPSAPRIAFAVAGSGIFTMNADGTGYTAVPNTTGGTDPAWSPDRRKIAFTIPSGPEAGLYVIGATGSQKTRLRAGPAGAPAWSPDGAKIAFHASVAGGTHLFVVNGNGTNLQQATAVGTVNRDPAWSPSGDRMVFYSNRSPGAGIWLMNSNGTNRRRINSCSSCGSPAWSPVMGDERIVFSHWYDGTVPTAGLRIITSIGGEGLNIVYGTAHASTDLKPTWSPDGSQLVFASAMLGGPRDLVRVEADGTGAARLVATSSVENAPAWAR